jgi:hypothetical protein
MKCFIVFRVYKMTDSHYHDDLVDSKFMLILHGFH